jgi:hypothetical protein
LKKPGEKSIQKNQDRNEVVFEEKGDWIYEYDKSLLQKINIFSLNVIKGRERAR